MAKFFRYLSYVIRHRWFVMIECFKRGLIWRGLTHDLSKFHPSEFFPYMVAENRIISASPQKGSDGRP